MNLTITDITAIVTALVVGTIMIVAVFKSNKK
jgi:hypothetical protein